MKNSTKLFTLALCASVALTAQNAFGLISLANVSKEKAKEMGIVMKARKNGDAGMKVWLEFKQEGELKGFTYAELRMSSEEGEHMLSAMLRVNPFHHRQPEDVTTVAFSADPSQLKHCEFWVVTYGAPRSGEGYILKVSDFLDLNNPATEK